MQAPDWVPQREAAAAARAGARQDFAEVDVDAKVKYSQNQSAEEIALMAEQLVKLVKTTLEQPEESTPRTAEEQEKLLRRIHEELRAQFKDFADGFPLVLRGIVYEQRFHRAAFIEYAEQCYRPKALAGFKSHVEFLETQAKYLFYVVKHEDPKRARNRSAMNAYLKETTETLLKEHTRFIEAQKETERRMKERKILSVAEKRDRLLALAQKRAAAQDAAARPTAASAAAESAAEPAAESAAEPAADADIL